MNRKFLWLLIGVIVLVVIILGLKKGGVIGKEEGLKVATEKVTKRTIIETVNASGKVYPEIEVKVSPDISGEIVELKVDEGDSVRKGQVLAKIYADIYSTQRNQAAAVVNQQEAMVENNKAQLESSKSAQDLAQRTFDRQKQLLDQKVISRSEFEQAENALHAAQANYNAALQGIRSQQAAAASAQANLIKANKDLSRTDILAPMAGIVSLLNVKKGERVVGNSMMAGTEMMRIADMNVIEVQVDVGENDIPKVKLGDSALVEIDAYNTRKFKGIVTKIASSSIGANSSGSSALSSTSTDVTNYKVHIRLLPSSYQDLLNPSRSKHFPFHPGMNASADIQTRTRSNVLAVAINAVTTREKGTDNAVNTKKEDKNTEAGLQEDQKTSVSTDLDEVVFVVQPDKSVKRIKVRTDVQDINYIEILGGLKEGDEVVTAPYNIVSKTLKDGTKVQIVPKEKLFEAKK